MTMSQMALMNATRGSKRIPSAARAVMLAIAGSALIAVCARIQVPMWPVPMTMQTFAVLLIGLAYGSRLGTATVAPSLFEGAIGLRSEERRVGQACGRTCKSRCAREH